MFFVILRPILCEKWKIAPPIRKEPPLKGLNLWIWEKNRPEFWRRPFFFFFGGHLILGGKNLWILNSGRKITLNFGEDLFFFFLEITWFWAEKTFELWILAEKSLWILANTFFFFFFFGDHLILGGKNLWIVNFGRKITLNFGEDLFFFFFFGDHLIFGGKNLWISELSETFRLKFRTNRLKLIQGQWKFESRSFAHFSLFQNSPPLFQILATRLCTLYVISWSYERNFSFLNKNAVIYRTYQNFSLN